MGAHHMLEAKQEEEIPPMLIRSPLRLGLFAGKWCSYSAPPDLPSDQREEDGGALVFNSPELEEDLEVLGAPSVTLELESDESIAYVAARLSDVSPDGKATRVTYGIKNLAHRDGHAHPEKLEPRKKYRISLQMNDFGHVFPRGHRFRLSLSTSYWPLAWTPPEITTLRLYPTNSLLQLPVKIAEGTTDISFAEAAGAEPTTQLTVLKKPQQKWEVVRDLAVDQSTLRVLVNGGRRRLEEIDLTINDATEEKYSIINDSLETVRGETFNFTELERKDWKIRTETHTVLTSDKEHFYVHAKLDAYEGEARVFSKNWNEKIPRNLL